MLFERIISPGLAHYSYLIGDGNEAVVIDPRRDGEDYIWRALEAGMQITHILETHRHEDFVSGSVILAQRTGAQVWHADAQLPYKYGKPVTAGQTWQIGALTLQALLTPGHTEGSMSYVLHEPGGHPWMVFCGDVLFTGEVGRVDFLGMERAPEMAAHLYESIFHKLLPLGDGVLLCPAHGAGSACGSDIADRPWSTLGLERELNPRLQASTREAFILDVARQLPKPPYFARMEAWNLAGAPPQSCLPVPKLLSAMAFMSFVEASDATTIIDVRDMMSFAGAHIPGALSIPLADLPTYAGWWAPYDVPLLLVLDDQDPLAAVRYLSRLGYDDIAGYLVGGMPAWLFARMPVEKVRLVAPQALANGSAPVWLLDVRAPEEVAGGVISGAHHIYLKELAQRLDEVPTDEPVVVYCDSGQRAMLAAGLLQRAGCRQVSILAGGLRAWRGDGLPLAPLQ